MRLSGTPKKRKVNSKIMKNSSNPLQTQVRGEIVRKNNNFLRMTCKTGEKRLLRSPMTKLGLVRRRGKVELQMRIMLMRTVRNNAL
jgi:hypothetical protein